MPDANNAPGLRAVVDHRIEQIRKWEAGDYHAEHDTFSFAHGYGTALVKSVDDLASELAESRRRDLAVRLAFKHDRDCAGEGEGDCCLRRWRVVAILFGEARNITDDEQMEADYFGREQSTSITGGEGNA